MAEWMVVPQLGGGAGFGQDTTLSFRPAKFEIPKGWSPSQEAGSGSWR